MKKFADQLIAAFYINTRGLEGLRRKKGAGDRHLFNNFDLLLISIWINKFIRVKNSKTIIT
jgi:hypothetical protein